MILVSSSFDKDTYGKVLILYRGLICVSSIDLKCQMIVRMLQVLKLEVEAVEQTVTMSAMDKSIQFDYPIPYKNSAFETMVDMSKTDFSFNDNYPKTYPFTNIILQHLFELLYKIYPQLKEIAIETGNK